MAGAFAIKGSTMPGIPQTSAFKVFLLEYARTGNISASAKTAGITRSAIYKRKEVDSKFVQAMESAEADYNENVIEGAIKQRGIQGVHKPLYHQGEPVYLTRPKMDPENPGQILRNANGVPIREFILDEHDQPIQAYEKVYSDRLLELHAKSRIPAYNTTKTELSGPGGGPIELANMSDYERARRVAFALRKGMLAAQSEQPATLAAQPEVDYTTDELSPEDLA